MREFSEKYYETARWCVDHNLSFWMMDWMGQGRSGRYIPSNPQKRHGSDFALDVEDLNYFMTAYVKPSSVHPDRGRIPAVMLAHSMGANIGLRYLATHHDMFECAAFTAPLIGIKAFHYIPQCVASWLAALLALPFGRLYIPGGADWGKRLEHVRLSSDPIRKMIQTRWSKADEGLRCGDVTFGWVRHAQASCLTVQNAKTLRAVQTPCFFALPKQEDLVDNVQAYKAISKLSHAHYADYPDAAHEILMEKDEIRDDFLNRFFNLIKENVIDRPERLKPF